MARNPCPARRNPFTKRRSLLQTADRVGLKKAGADRSEYDASCMPIYAMQSWNLLQVNVAHCHGTSISSCVLRLGRLSCHCR